MSLSDRFIVLVISNVYRGNAVLVTLNVLKIQKKHAWKPEWLALLKQL